MNEVQALIDKARELVKPHSYYEVAKRLGIATQTLSRVRNRGGTLDNEASVKLAGLLGQPEMDVITLMERERAKTPEKREFWEKRLPRIVPVVAIMGLTTGVTYVTQVVREDGLTTISQAIHYAHALRRWLRQTAYGLGRCAARMVYKGESMLDARMPLTVHRMFPLLSARQ